MSEVPVAPAVRRAARRIALLAACAGLLAAATFAAAAPVAQVSRASVQFGFVEKGAVSPVQPVFVTNTGDASLTIAASNVAGAQAAAYTVAGTCGPPATLAPGGRCRIDLTVSPPFTLGPGAPLNATLTLQSDAGAVDIVLHAAVDPGFTEPPFVSAPAYLDFPAQAVGSVAPPLTIAVTNKSTESFALTQLDLVGGTAGDFTLSADCATGDSFRPGRTCTATIGFVPQASGPRATELSMQTTLHGTTGVMRFSITGVGGAATPVTVVEYYNATLDHYFITWVPAEQANLDAGNTPTRWTRTGFAFRAYTAGQAGTSPVCRYYLPPAFGDSHFFGRGTAECDATGLAHPAFVLEDSTFMHLYLPTAGVCPPGTTPIYRVFSNRPDANHRYMTDRAIRDQMVARGWLAEGDGPDLIVMCGA